MVTRKIIECLTINELLIMKRFRFQILFYLRKNRKPKSGEYPIYLRVTISGEQSTISTGRSIKSRFWNPKIGRVRASFDGFDQINNHLKSLQTQVYEQFTNIEK